MKCHKCLEAEAEIMEEGSSWCIECRKEKRRKDIEDFDRCRKGMMERFRAGFYG